LLVSTVSTVMASPFLKGFGVNDRSGQEFRAAL
jgi:hypothetical protein